MIPKKGAVAYGSRQIWFSITYSDRKTLSIEVHPDRRVAIKAPHGTDTDEIRKRVRKRAAWIQRQQDFFLSFEPRTPPRRYVSGETFNYLGRRYRLQVVPTDVGGVKIKGGKLLVHTKSKTPQVVRECMRSWYYQRASVYFRQRFEVCWVPFSTKGLSRPVLVFRLMTHRWGSMSSNGRLTLNTELMGAPRECIDYVITHELCHLLHPDHGSGFWKLLELVMPDWKRRKMKLESWMS